MLRRSLPISKVVISHLTTVGMDRIFKMCEMYHPWIDRISKEVRDQYRSHHQRHPASDSQPFAIRQHHKRPPPLPHHLEVRTPIGKWLIMTYNDPESRRRTPCYLPTLEPGRLCPVGGETRCAEVMALNKEWKLRFENVQPEWFNEFLSSSLTVGLESFSWFFGAVSGKRCFARNGFKQRDKRQRHYAHRGYNGSQTFIGMFKGWRLLGWCGTPG